MSQQEEKKTSVVKPRFALTKSGTGCERLENPLFPTPPATSCLTPRKPPLLHNPFKAKNKKAFEQKNQQVNNKCGAFLY